MSLLATPRREAVSVPSSSGSSRRGAGHDGRCRFLIVSVPSSSGKFSSVTIASSATRYATSSFSPLFVGEVLVGVAAFESSRGCGICFSPLFVGEVLVGSPEQCRARRKPRMFQSPLRRGSSRRSCRGLAVGMRCYRFQSPLRRGSSRRCDAGGGAWSVAGSCFSPLFVGEVLVGVADSPEPSRARSSFSPLFVGEVLVGALRRLGTRRGNGAFQSPLRRGSSRRVSCFRGHGANGARVSVPSSSGKFSSVPEGAAQWRRCFTVSVPSSSGKFSSACVPHVSGSRSAVSVPSSSGKFSSVKRFVHAAC